jgi:hypothetical protein
VPVVDVSVGGVAVVPGVVVPGADDVVIASPVERGAVVDEVGGCASVDGVGSGVAGVVVAGVDAGAVVLGVVVVGFVVAVVLV